MEKEFEDFIKLSDHLRNGYEDSLLPVEHDWRTILDTTLGDVPDLLKIIYSKYSGTYYEIENQKLMDFIPGYLLIHISEYKKDFDELKAILNSKGIDGKFAPVLRNYSSDFYAIEINTGSIYLIFHDDDEIDLIHNSSYDFIYTLKKNYEEKVYFLDEDDYLDYDADLEYEVARKYNEGVEFWEEK